jgi:hypothetical protein
MYHQEPMGMLGGLVLIPMQTPVVEVKNAGVELAAAVLEGLVLM